MFERLLSRLPEGALPPGEGLTWTRAVDLCVYLSAAVLIRAFVAGSIIGGLGGSC